VLKNRVVSTGYNGTPEGFPNCADNGCIRCHDAWLFKQDRADEMSDADHVAGAALDRCICLHAEQNAFLTAARFGIALEGATLYTTVSPCFGCLKESLQVGIERIVYDRWYAASYSPALADQYVALYTHLGDGDPSKFEAIGGRRPGIEREGQPDPYTELGGRTVALDPPPPTSN
jgi:dCMP deaminase